MEQQETETLDTTAIVDDLIEHVRNIDNDDMDRAVDAPTSEQVRRNTVRNARREAEDAAERYEDAVKDDPPKEMRAGDVIGPGDKVTEDGVEYVNTSGAWLSVPPSEYPMGYQRRETPQDTRPFKAGENVNPGDLRQYQGTVYEALQAHTTADHWAPDVAHSLWTKA